MSIPSTPYLKMGEKISVGLEIGRAGHPLISARHTDEMLAAAAGSAQSLWNSLSAAAGGSIFFDPVSGSIRAGQGSVPAAAYHNLCTQASRCWPSFRKVP